VLLFVVSLRREEGDGAVQIGFWGVNSSRRQGPPDRGGCSAPRYRAPAECGHDKLLANSRKRRGFCPSCGARRMAQSAAHQVDHVIPHVPVRQWVLSLPIPL
jgi:hypothetical protein